jgi:CDP-diacylglycerol--serine O-phosphatidyltransferase
VFLLVVLFVALLVSYPWYVLTAGSVLYLASLPLGWLSYRQYVRKDAEAAAAKAMPAATPGQAVSSPAHHGLPPSDEEDRPSRLN